MNYNEAVSQIAAWGREVPAFSLNPVCQTTLLTHGRKTEKAIVMFHGYTNCPQQFRQLGDLYHARGYNVLLPRLPFHGLADRMNEMVVKLTANHILDTANKAVDIAQGLGEQVTVMGLSLGGVMAGWLAQNREVERAVLFSPAFGVKIMPAFLTPILSFAFRRFPNQFQWWDPTNKDPNVGAQHGYPRFATRPLGHIFHLSQQLKAQAKQSAPATKNIFVVTNGNDQGVNYDLIQHMVWQWRRWGDVTVKTHHFPVSDELDHDFIEPTHPKQHIDYVYPILMDWLEG